MNDYERGWIEALVDGEGSLMLTRYRNGWNSFLSISNTNRALIERAKEIIGEGYIQTQTRAGYKPSYSLRLHSNALRRFLPTISLIAKERQRLILIEALPFLRARHLGGSKPKDIHREKLSSLETEIKLLNYRGPRKVATHLQSFYSERKNREGKSK